MKRIAVYPGSFDPITLGHIDLIYRGLHLFDKLIIGVGINSQKKPMFTVDERIALIKKAVQVDGKCVCVDYFEGMLGDFADSHKAKAILRGMRTLSDFDFEFQIAYANQALYPHIDTVFMATDPKLSAVSSSVVRELVRRGGKLDGLEGFVTKDVAYYIRENHRRLP